MFLFSTIINNKSFSIVIVPTIITIIIVIVIVVVVVVVQQMWNSIYTTQEGGELGIKIILTKIQNKLNKCFKKFITVNLTMNAIKKIREKITNKWIFTCFGKTRLCLCLEQTKFEDSTIQAFSGSKILQLTCNVSINLYK